MALDPDSPFDPRDPSPPAARDEDVPASAPVHPHADHIPFLYGTDPLNPIFAPPVLIEDLNADPGPARDTPDPMPDPISDPIPDPEPPSPSLCGPDPGVFHPVAGKPRP